MSSTFSYSYPFALGLLAAVNPCGFPMLPAYLSYFVRGGDEEAPGGRIGLAVRSAVAVSCGFVVVFAVLGTLFELGVSVFMSWVPWVMLVLAAGMAALGLVGLAGRRVDLRIPHLTIGGRSRSLPSMAGFGVSYAVGSLTCSLPLFLAGIASTFTRSGVAAGVGTFVAYALGMAAVLTVVTVAVAAARTSVVAALRRGGRYVDRVASALLLVVAAYLADYWVSYLLDPSTTTGPVASVERFQTALVDLLSHAGVQAVVAAAAAGLVAAALLSRWMRSRATAGPS